MVFPSNVTHQMRCLTPSLIRKTARRSPGWFPSSTSTCVLLIPFFLYSSSIRWRASSTVYGSSGEPVFRSASLARAEALICLLPRNFTSLSIGRSTTVKVTITPAAGRKLRTTLHVQKHAGLHEPPHVVVHRVAVERPFLASADERLDLLPRDDIVAHDAHGNHLLTGLGFLRLGNFFDGRRKLPRIGALHSHLRLRPLSAQADKVQHNVNAA